MGLEETSEEQKRRYESLKEEYERYKLKAQAVLKSRMITVSLLPSSSAGFYKCFVEMRLKCIDKKKKWRKIIVGVKFQNLAFFEMTKRLQADSGDEAGTSSSSQPLSNKCPSCAAADSDLRHMQMIVASLHGKLQSLEIDHANAKNEYEEVKIC